MTPRGTSRTAHRRGAWAVLAVPLALGGVTLAGLVAGLMGDGGWDWIAWAGLAAPLVVAEIARRKVTKVARSTIP